MSTLVSHEPQALASTPDNMASVHQPGMHSLPLHSLAVYSTAGASVGELTGNHAFNARQSAVLSLGGPPAVSQNPRADALHRELLAFKSSLDKEADGPKQSKATSSSKGVTSQSTRGMPSSRGSASGAFAASAYHRSSTTASILDSRLPRSSSAAVLRNALQLGGGSNSSLQSLARSSTAQEPVLIHAATAQDSGELAKISLGRGSSCSLSSVDFEENLDGGDSCASILDLLGVSLAADNTAIHVSTGHSGQAEHFTIGSGAVAVEPAAGANSARSSTASLQEVLIGTTHAGPRSTQADPRGSQQGSSSRAGSALRIRACSASPASRSKSLQAQVAAAGAATAAEPAPAKAVEEESLLPSRPILSFDGAPGLHVVYASSPGPSRLSSSSGGGSAMPYAWPTPPPGPAPAHPHPHAGCSGCRPSSRSTSLGGLPQSCNGPKYDAGFLDIISQAHEERLRWGPPSVQCSVSRAQTTAPGHRASILLGHACAQPVRSQASGDHVVLTRRRSQTISYLEQNALETRSTTTLLHRASRRLPPHLWGPGMESRLRVSGSQKF